tara:strand:+ start:44304 stop:44543 length:240 start_codon:yes stop_codon:yes gene_type:complete
MKIVKTASGKKQIKMSKKEWQSIGKKAGWFDKKDTCEENTCNTSFSTISDEDLLLAIKSKSSDHLEDYVEEAKRRGLIL